MRAYLFPGQGSQRVGMGKALSDGSAAARAVFERADDALGFALSRLCFEGPEAELVLTANQQPAILTVSVATLEAARAAGHAAPDIALGHSLGEWSALVCAGALRFEDAVRAVRLRGQFMQEAVPAGAGAMAAILGLPVADVEAACREADGLVTPANLHGGGQVVIAGEKAAVERAMAACKARGAKRALPLAVSAPFHCALMEPAARRLAEALAAVDIASLAIPVVTNVEAAPNRDAARVKELLVRQVTAPVRFEECVRALLAAGVRVAVEVGPGRVLTGLCKRIAPELAIEELPWN
ncbi:MAG: ACP S-malonyltransferase [Myxococcota bacterium]